MSTLTRCPQCLAAFTPDEVRAATDIIACASCKTQVAVHPQIEVLVAPLPPPLEMPKRFHIVEKQPEPEARPTELGDPYRTPFVKQAPLRPGLTIRWPAQPERRRLVYGVWTIVCAVAAITSGWPRGIVAIAAGLVGVFLFARAWNVAELHSDPETLSFDEGPVWRRKLQLAAADVEQLYTIRTRIKKAGRAILWFHVRVRDRAGRTHELARFQTPKEAWWLEERLERHLKITNRAVDGEHARRA